LDATQPDSSISAGPGARTEAERNFVWNAVWFTADYVAYGVATSFLNQSTVLPTFVSQLTDSTVLLGLVATIQSGGWLLPQVVVAGLVAGKPRKRPYLLRAAAVSRPIYLALAVFIFLVGAGNPVLLLAALYVALSAFAIADGCLSVAWYDIWGKAIPPNRRGRLLGLGQILNGPAGILVGGLVALILADPALPFPRNYAALFALAGVVFAFDFVALALLREPALPLPAGPQPHGSFLRLVLPILRRDSRFARLVALRLAFGVGMMVFPFYIVHARKALGFGPEYVGAFLSCQILGGVLAGFAYGQVADRRGPRAVVRLGLLVAFLCPGLALLTHFASAALGPLAFYAVAAIFVGIGASFSSMMIGFTNYILEIAPATDRSTYTGLYNTINGALLVVPLLAGWFLEVASYPALFGVVLAVIAVAGVGSLDLPEPRASARPKPA